MAVIQSQGQITRLETSREANWWPTSNYGSLNLYGDLTQDYASIYRTQPNVRTVVSFLARNIAQLGLKVYKRVSDDEREQLNSHPLAKLIRRPNHFTTRYRFIESLVTDLAIYDNAFWLKVRTENDIALLRMPPQYVEEVGKNRFRPTRYRMFGIEDLVYDAEEVVHYRGHNPDNPKWGQSPLESLRRILAEEESSGQAREYFWRNHSRAEVALTHPGELTEGAQQRLRAQWESLYSGATNTGKTAILEEGMDVKDISVSAKDAQYIEARKLSREECASAFHISPAMVGILEHANFANIKEQHKMLYQDSLGPWLVMIEEDIELQLLPEFPDNEDIYVEFNIAEKLKGDFEEQASAAQASVGAPWITRNEQRARFNMPRVEGGDELITPLNVLLGGMASPQDADPNKPSNSSASLPLPADDIAKLVAAATALIRAGFKPEESLAAVGLDPIEHLGLLPVTLRDVTPSAEVPAGAGGEAEGQASLQNATPDERALFGLYFDKVRGVVLGDLGRKPDADAARLFDSERWNGELWNLLGRTDEAFARADDVNGRVLAGLELALSNPEPKQAIKQMFHEMAEGTL